MRNSRRAVAIYFTHSVLKTQMKYKGTDWKKHLRWSGITKRQIPAEFGYKFGTDILLIIAYLIC